MTRSNPSRVVTIALAIALVAAIVGWWQASSTRSQAPSSTSPRSLTVPVAQRMLTVSVPVRATVTSRDAVTVGSGTQAVVTSLGVGLNEEVSEGKVVGSIDGSGVLILQGQLPMYRDLVPGMQGPDVAQLDSSLNRLGLLPQPNDRFDRSTADALVRAYRDQGVAAPTDSEAEKAARSVSQELVAAQSELAKARRHLDTARQIDDPMAIAEADDAVADAVDAQAAAEADGAAAVAAAQAEVERARQSGEEDTIRHAEINLHNASSARDRSVAAAARAVARARAAADAVRTYPPSADAVADVRTANDALALVQARFDEASLAASVSVPAASIVYLPALPSRVLSVDARVGERLDGTGGMVTLSSQAIGLVSEISDVEASSVSVGQSAIVDDPLVGAEPLDATVAEMADQPGDTTTVSLATSAPLAAALVGQNIRASIQIGSSERDVLVVSTSAVAQHPEGAVVEVLDSDGRAVAHVVELGLEADGYVEVRHATPALHVGDQAIVGSAEGASVSVRQPTTRGRPGEEGG